MIRQAAFISIGLCLCTWPPLATPGSATGDGPPPTLKPVASTGSGLLLQEPLDLSKYTRREFEVESATVGRDKIGKKWTTAITPLPPPPPDRAGRPLDEDGVRRYMLQIRDLFDRGDAVAVSDVGLISTQEDIIRTPMYNHVAAFSNSAVHAYLLVQRDAGVRDWGTFAIVQDRSADPPLDYFAEIKGSHVKFEGTACYKCHSSGPLAVHPVREDLVSDVPLLAAINRHIADLPQSRLHFPAADPPGDYGPPLRLKACARCHDADATRGPLFRAQSHPIRVLVDFGHMPPGRRLTPAELAELKSWLDEKR